MEIAMLSSDRADFTAREVVRHREEYLLLLFSCQVMSCRPHGLQHARLLCPLLSPGVCSDSCPLNHWCHPLILCCPLLLLSVFPSIRVFFSESALCFKWPKYWSFSFSISPFSEYVGLISFRIDWMDLLAVQGTLKRLLHSSKASIFLVLSLLFGPTLTSVT